MAASSEQKRRPHQPISCCISPPRHTALTWPSHGPWAPQHRPLEPSPPGTHPGWLCRCRLARSTETKALAGAVDWRSGATNGDVQTMAGCEDLWVGPSFRKEKHLGQNQSLCSVSLIFELLPAQSLLFFAAGGLSIITSHRNP